MTSRRGGCTVGPTIRVSLSEWPLAVLAEASKTARNFVVVLDCFYTTCIGMS